MKYRLTCKHYDEGEINSHDDCKVTNIGYVSVAKQVERFTLAGKRLEAYRSGEFDFDDGIDDGRPFDPTLESNFDLSDASRILNDLEMKAETKTESAVEDGIDKSLSNDENLE